MLANPLLAGRLQEYTNLCYNFRQKAAFISKQSPLEGLITTIRLAARHKD